MFKQMNAAIKNSVRKLDTKTLLHSRVVLYALCILAVINVVYLANSRDKTNLFLFLIIGFLTSFFSKNMIVILFVALAASQLLCRCMGRRMFEGAENMEKEGTEDTEKEGTEDMEKTDDDMDPKEDPSKSLMASAISDATKANESKESEDAEKKRELYDKLKGDFNEFQSIQKEILAGMKEIDPLLSKAELFIEKFEDYGKKLKK